MLPLTVGVASALLVFSGLVFAFGGAGTTRAAPAGPTAPGPTTPPGTGGSTSPEGAPAPDAPHVVKGAVSGSGEPTPVTVSLKLGDLLRVKVVPEAGLDAQTGLTMPKDAVVADYFQKGFKGDVQRLFPIQNGVLYSDTLTPSGSVALEANDLGKEGSAEWLAFIAPTAGDYAIVVRGRARSAGSYTLTWQTRGPAGRVASAKHLDADPRWLDHDSVTALARDEQAFLGDPAFFAEKEFRTDGDDTRPTPQSIDSMVATGT